MTKLANRVFAGFLLGVSAMVFGACSIGEPVGDPGPEVIWDEHTQECMLDGNPVTVNGASNQVVCDTLADSAANGTLERNESPAVSPAAMLCCAEICNCTPSGCECSGAVCVRCAV